MISLLQFVLFTDNGLFPASFIETGIRALFFFKNEFHLVWCIESLKNSLLNVGVSIVMGVFRFVNVAVTALFSFS